uniref:hypothetical protein n=1 Tax=Shewanella sp. TaxID=50422 RepID=UPI004047C779
MKYKHSINKLTTLFPNTPTVELIDLFSKVKYPEQYNIISMSGYYRTVEYTVEPNLPMMFNTMLTTDTTKTNYVYYDEYFMLTKANTSYYHKVTTLHYTDTNTTVERFRANNNNCNSNCNSNDVVKVTTPSSVYIEVGNRVVTLTNS